MKILGIDPGTSRVGYGLIKKQKNDLELITCGIFDTSANPAPTKTDSQPIAIKEKNLHKRYLKLAKALNAFIKEFHPDVVAIEKIYFSKNQKTAIEVIQARGIIILIALQNNIEIIEYAPVEIKKAVTDYGSADKKMVAKMVERILKIDKIKGVDDISDALAIAITAAFHANLINT